MEEEQLQSAITADDMVNHPPHYTSGGVECIEAIEASMTPDEYKGFLKGQVMRYIWRYEKKWNPVEDLHKAEFYLDKLIDKLEAERSNDGD